MTKTFSRNLDRRHFLGGAAMGLAGAALLPGVRAASAAPEVSSITITQAVPSFAFIQNYLAKELGYYADEGLEVEIVVTGGGGPDVQAVLAGDAAFTINDGAQVLPAVAKGQKLLCLMATLDRNVINVSMTKAAAERTGVGPDSPIEKKLAALKGLKIGVTRPGSLTWQLARFNLVSAGLDPDSDAEIIGLGGGPAVSAGLEQGAVDVIYISVPLGERVVLKGDAIMLIDNAAGQDPNMPVFMMEGLWADPGFAAEKPMTAQACVNALKRASDFVLQAPVEDIAAALKGPFGGLPAELLTAGIQGVKPAVAKSYRFDQKTLDVTMDVLEVNGAIDHRFTLDEVFDPRFLG